MSSKKPPLHPSTPARPPCKHGRCRWAASCKLEPYFPASKKRDLYNVLRLFSSTFVIEQLDTLPPHRRQDFITSIVYEANFRASHPVGGCCSALLSLGRRLRYCKIELEIVNMDLEFYRARSSELLFKNHESMNAMAGS